MSETVQTFTNGTVKIADEVIAIIAGTAALETDGVAPVDPADVRARKSIKNVKIYVLEGQVNVALSVAVKQGYKIGEVTKDVQQKIKTAIETMTGMLVASVDISVMGLAGTY
ncbi:MAG: Asp23/Gls24 family envelope stress response protein [Defluviitaleaceae bacterium]|nr:Asp23/Gls24 family envelope stress response protein [Defluviitaleaceae bacterium]MCL2836754.1 Asp23/Gls24 family envelope stress response protein [Defluviitaleaceae bacterium]